VTRSARKPQRTCGIERLLAQAARAARACASVRALALAAAVGVAVTVLTLDPGPAVSQGAVESTWKFKDTKKALDEISNGPVTDALSKKAFPKPIKDPSTKKTVDRAQPLYLEGDQLIYDTKGNRVIARGNVQVYYNNYILTANEVIYDQGANTLTAVGNVTLKDPEGQITRAERYTLSDDFRDGFVESINIVTKDESRIAGQRANRRDGNVTEFVNGKFTPCKSADGMPPLWCIGAKRIVHDAQNASVTYQDAQFELFGVPIFYMPYFSHPDPSVKRRSGFLMPEHSSSTALGYGVEIPYYYALAPNYDFLFHPKYLSKQGVLWQGEWRHRLEFGAYTVKLAGIDQDGSKLPSEASRQAMLDGWRGSVQTSGAFNFASWWNFGWDVTLESDDSFRRFYKLDSVLQTDRVNTVYLTGQSPRNYFSARLYHFGGLLATDTPRAESQVHPVIDHNYVFADPVAGGELSWSSNFVSFSRDDAIRNTGHTDITKATTEVRWRRRLTDSLGITYTPEANLRGDIYHYGGIVDPLTGQFVNEESAARGLATGGLTIAYPWVAHTAGASHVIEPIGQIVSRQGSVNQRRLPDEDARSLVFDDTNLFQFSKFSGYDRAETGTRVNVGAQYSFQLNSGGYARVLAGQSFHIAGDNAYKTPGYDADGKYLYNPYSGLESARSDYVLGAYIAPSTMFRFISQSRFDDQSFDLRRQDFYGQMTLGPLSLQSTYTYVAADLNSGLIKSQQDIFAGAVLRLTDRWSLIGTVRYDIDAHQRLQEIYALKYADECFVLTASYTDTHITNQSLGIKEDRTLMLRFELKHLGEFRYKTDALDHVFGENQPNK